jgi:hypothetical protein
LTLSPARSIAAEKVQDEFGQERRDQSQGQHVQRHRDEIKMTAALRGFMLSATSVAR